MIAPQDSTSGSNFCITCLDDFENGEILIFASGDNFNIRKD